jgi:hypothetical protein
LSIISTTLGIWLASSAKSSETAPNNPYYYCAYSMLVVASFMVCDSNIVLAGIGVTSRDPKRACHTRLARPRQDPWK